MIMKATSSWEKWLGILVVVGTVSIACPGNDTAMKTKTNTVEVPRPNPNKDLPPIYENTFSDIEKWLNSSGFPWKQQSLEIGKRKLTFIDFTPYSGMPAHHVFVYQVLNQSVRLLFCSIVWNPPKQGLSLSYRYDVKTDSVIVSAGDAVCFTVRLTTLWCE
jgi:hypothetical protein